MKDNNTVTKLAVIASIAKKDRVVKFTTLTHYLNVEYLMTCHKELKGGKAAGVDGRTLESYSEEEMHQALTQTAQLIQAGKYQPQPVRRVYIEKENGKKRPLGIPSVIDKVVQLAVTKILEMLYEPLFLPVSFGYRPGRNAHEALKDINHMIMGQKVNWIIDSDIAGFFDHVDHAWMMRCLSERIKDPNFKRLILKFLRAGMMEEGRYSATETGTPQGGILSPVLANIYLHYVLDLWFEKRMKKTLRGYTQLVRYADDFVIGVQHPDEAQTIREEVEKRLQKFGLSLSKEKTRILEFGRFAAENRKKRKEGHPETFDFLGLTHYCTTTKDGRFQVKLKTSRKRMNRAASAMNDWIKRARSVMPLQQIWTHLASKLHGHYQYYGVSGNFEGIHWFYHKTVRLIYTWANRRSQKKTWNMNAYYAYLTAHPLPKPKLTYAIYNTW